MTEPDVASSDATNIDTRISRDADDYVINGRKSWTSGALDTRCKIMIVMGQSDPDNPDRYRRQSMILVPLPHSGVVIKRMLPVFGYDEAPHGHAEVVFDNVRIPAANMLLGEGRGFEIAQGRLGWTFAIVSTTSIPKPAPMSPMEAIVDPSYPGSRLNADHPENGVLIPCVFT